MNPYREPALPNIDVYSSEYRVFGNKCPKCKAYGYRYVTYVGYKYVQLTEYAEYACAHYVCRVCNYEFLIDEIHGRDGWK